MAAWILFSGSMVRGSVVKPGFEDGGGWNYNAGSYVGISFVAPAAHSGTRGLKVETTVGWLSTLSYATVEQGEIPVIGGREYVFSAWQKSVTPYAWMSLRISWYDASKGLLSSDQVDFSDSIENDWQLRNMIKTAPVSATTASLVIVAVLHPWAARVLYVDDISFVDQATFSTEINMPSGYYGHINDITQPADIYTHGGNIVIAYQNLCTNDQIQTYLNAAYQAGIKVILETPREAGKTYVTSDLALLQNYVRNFDSHPALYGWYIADEPLPVPEVDAACQAGYNTIKQYSDKPVLIVVSSTGQYVTTFTDSCDIMGYDPYYCLVDQPEFGFLNYSYQSMVDDTSYLSRLDGKTYWIILQGYGRVRYALDGHRLPTLNEMRFMLYYAVHENARGWMVWMHSYMKDSIAHSLDPYPFGGVQWQEDVMTSLSNEIHVLGAALTTTPLSGVTCNNTQILYSLWKDPAIGAYYLVTINNSNADMTATFTLNLAGFTYVQPLFEGRVAMRLSNRIFTDQYGRNRVHVYQLLTQAPPKIPGDANNDGKVDVGDLGILAANYGTARGATWENGDFNSDGSVDVGDLGILAANYGRGVNTATDFNVDYAKAFGSRVENAGAMEQKRNLACSSLGLPLVAGVFLAGLFLREIQH